MLWCLLGGSDTCGASKKLHLLRNRHCEVWPPRVLPLAEQTYTKVAVTLHLISSSVWDRSQDFAPLALDVANRLSQAGNDMKRSAAARGLSTEVVTQSRQRSKKKSEKIVQVDSSKRDVHGLTL